MFFYCFKIFNLIQYIKIMNQDIETKNCQQVLRKNNLFPIKKLGKGGFGSVFLVSRLSSRGNQTELFSVKCTNKKNFAKKPMLRKYLKQQIEIQSHFDHVNIVKIIRSFDDDGWNFMVMEYCDIGNLYNIQLQKPKKVFDFSQAKKYMLDILDGLSHLHKHNVIHRDLKPENILLTKNNHTQQIRTKICDFGFAKQTQQQSSTFCGTTYFMAPEIFAKKKYDNSVDIWAAGVIFFYMIFGVYPFKSINMLAQIQTKCKNKFNLQLIKVNQNDSLTKQDKKLLAKIFQKLFVIDSNQRLTLGQFRNLIKSGNRTERKNSQQQLSTLQTESDEQIIEYISQKIVFIQKTYQEVKGLAFLTILQELALKYFLDKYCLTLLLLNNNLCQPESTMAKLKQQLIQNQQKQSCVLQANMHKVQIPRFSQIFTTILSSDFNSYKQAYRVVLSHVFSKANKSIQNLSLRSQIKLKVFCCHSINRVFDQQHIRQIFVHYFNTINHKHSKASRSSDYRINQIAYWIEQQSAQKVNDTVRILCDKFYRKAK